MKIVELKNVTREYVTGEHSLKALDSVNLELEEGKFIVVLGQSGAGKSTLLNLLGGLDSPTDGTITVDGKDISKLSRDELAEYKASKVGFVFQFYNLIPTLTVLENVALARRLGSRKDFGRSRTRRPPEQLPCGTFGRRATARIHCKSDSKESENSSLRRADGRA